MFLYGEFPGVRIMDNTGDFYSLNSSSILLRRTRDFITSETWSPRGLICPFRQISGFERVRSSPLVPIWMCSTVVVHQLDMLRVTGSSPVTSTKISTSDLTLATEEVRDRWQVRVGEIYFGIM